MKLQELRNRKTNNKGFSLVELIIVIAIMAVLIAILAPQFIKYVEKSRKNADLDTIDEARTSLETAYSDLSADGDWPQGASATITLKQGSIEAKAAGDRTENPKIEAELKTELKADKGKGLKSSKWPSAGIVVKIDDTGKITYNDTDKEPSEFYGTSKTTTTTTDTDTGSDSE